MYLYSNWTYLDHHQPFFNPPSIGYHRNSHEFCFNHVTKTCHQPIQEGRRLQFSRQWRRHILAMVGSLEAQDCCHQENSHADCWSSETNCVCVCHIYGISYTILHHHELLAWSFKPIISNKFPIGISFSCKARLPQGHNHPRCPSQHPSSVRGAALVAQRHKWIVSISPFYHNDQLHWVLHA